MTSRLTTSKPLDTSIYVGQRVHELREARRWTLQKLANQCARVGAEWLGVYTLGAIEQGASRSRQRRVSVDDLMSLAAALNVAPTALLPPVEGLTTDDDSLNQLGVEAAAAELRLMASRLTGEVRDGDQ